MIAYNYQTLRQRRMAFKQLFLGLSFKAGLLIAICVFGILYVLQTSSLSTKGYKISELEKQVQTLKQESEQLEFAIASKRSMQSIQERLKGMDLVSAGNPEYVVLAGTAMARR